jgi:hypothetical protein
VRSPSEDDVTGVLRFERALRIMARGPLPAWPGRSLPIFDS